MQKNATQNKPNQVPKRSADEDHQGGSFSEQNGIKTKIENLSNQGT